MFRDRPLTWLFLLATVCVDLVWIAMIRDGDIATGRMSSSLLQGGGMGLIFAQSCLATILVVLKVHGSLLQASILTVVNGLLAWCVYLAGASDFDQWLAFFAMHSIQAIAVTSLWQLAHYRKEFLQRLTSLRVSMIELLGWTTLFAILSFGFRFPDFSKMSLLSVIAILIPGLVLHIEMMRGLNAQLRLAATLRITRILGIAFV